MGIPLLDARAAQRGIPLLDAETRHQRGIPLLDAKTQWNMHGQQDVRGISHWFCDAKTCCWPNTGFFGAKIVKSASGRGQFTIIHYNSFFTAAARHRRGDAGIGAAMSEPAPPRTIRVHPATCRPAGPKR